MSRRVGRWSVERISGTAAEVHARELPAAFEPTVWLIEASDTSVVLGSAQRDTYLDHARARQLGLEVVRRRSGGGAVLVVPGELLWVDVLVPVGDVLWSDDVGRSFHPLGQLWAEVVAALGVRTALHLGGFERSPASDVVCFAGRGPGEVFVADAKVVGMAQRRTRAGARFQCALSLRWRPQPLVEVFASVPIDGFADVVAAAGYGLGCSVADAEAALLAQLPLL